MAEVRFIAGITKCEGGYIVVASSELLNGGLPKPQNILQAMAGNERFEHVVCATIEEVIAVIKRLNPKTVDEMIGAK